MGKKVTFLTVLKMAGIGAIGGALGIGGAWLACDLIDNHFSSMSQGLPLLAPGVHMKSGDHNIVITDQFCELLSYGTTQEDEYLVMNSFKESTKNLNQYNSKLNFNLCTTDSTIAEKYDITYVDSVKKDDITLYATEGVLSNNPGVMGNTDWDYDFFTHEMKDLSITFRKKYLLQVWTMKDTIEGTLNPYNCAAYTTFSHEMMHCLGFAHIDDQESIMNTLCTLTSPKDFTTYDIQLMDKYNVQFYNAEPTYYVSTTNDASSSYTTSYVDTNNSNKDYTY